MPEELLPLHSLLYNIPPIPSMLPHYTHSPSSTDAFQLCLSPFQLLPKLTGKPQHSQLRRIFKGQRLLHVYDVSPEESRQGESGGTKPLRNFTQFWTRWEGDMKACLGRLFLVNMGPSKWKKQDITSLEKKKTWPNSTKCHNQRY